MELRVGLGWDGSAYVFSVSHRCPGGGRPHFAARQGVAGVRRWESWVYLASKVKRQILYLYLYLYL
jgi:hypothetical protein